MLLSGLELLELEDKLKNDSLGEIRQIVGDLEVCFHCLGKYEGRDKVVRALGLMELVLEVVLVNNVLDKSVLEPFF